MGKQIMIDILVVLLVPVILIGGYYFWKTNDGTLLSFVSSDITLPGDEDKELGAKTKLALVTLNSIDFNAEFFKDEAFASLRDLTATVSTTPLGREYPFTSPELIKKLIKNSKPGVNGAPIRNSQPVNINSQIETIKSSSPVKPK